MTNRGNIDTTPKQSPKKRAKWSPISSNAHLFLRLQRCWICSSRPNGQLTILLGDFEEIEGEHGVIFSIMTTHLPTHHYQRHDTNWSPPYLSDLAPCDFVLFTRLKRDMKGKHFGTIKEVKQNLLKGSKNIIVKKTVLNRETTTRNEWYYITVRGNYFEGVTTKFPLLLGHPSHFILSWFWCFWIGKCTT